MAVTRSLRGGFTVPKYSVNMTVFDNTENSDIILQELSKIFELHLACILIISSLLFGPMPGIVTCSCLDLDIGQFKQQ